VSANRLGIVLLILLGWESLASPTKKLAYDCIAKDGSKIEVESVGEKLLFKLYDQKSNLIKEVPIHQHLAFIDEGKEPIDYHFSLPEIEIRDQFDRAKPQHYRVAFIREGRILRGLTCKPASLGIPIRNLEKPEDFIRSDNLWLNRAARGFRTSDSLSNESVQMWKAVIGRFAQFQKELPPAEFEGLVRKTFSRVQVVSPGAAQQILESLEGDSKEVWKGILKVFNFEKLSPLERWVWWVELGEQGNFEAVRSAIRELFRSGFFKDRQMENFFRIQTARSLKKMSKRERDQILSTGLDLREKEYLIKLWENTDSPRVKS